MKETIKKAFDRWFMYEFLNKPHNIDSTIMTIMMDNNWFQTNDKDEQHKLYEWLSNTDFSLLVETLGGGNNYLDETIICQACEQYRRSWKHNSLQCEQLNDVELCQFFKNKDSATKEISKLRENIKKFQISTPIPQFITKYINTLELSREENTYTVITYFVTSKFIDNSYRCFNIKTNELETLDLLQEYFKGNIFMKQL